MRYKINSIEIRSENAAKPHTLQSSHLLQYIKNIGQVEKTLDYGCGKLRYGHELAAISETITFTDSKIQTTRSQTIRNQKTSVQDYIKQYIPNGKCIAVEDINNHEEKYNLITCINVLSAIPCPQSISITLSNIKQLLDRTGVALFVTQHRSSHFRKYENPKNKHLYGFIHNTKSPSYYGIMRKELVSKLLSEHGFHIRSSKIITESSYIEVTIAP